MGHYRRLLLGMEMKIHKSSLQRRTVKLSSSHWNHRQEFRCREEITNFFSRERWRIDFFSYLSVLEFQDLEISPVLFWCFWFGIWGNWSCHSWTGSRQLTLISPSLRNVIGFNIVLIISTAYCYCSISYWWYSQLIKIRTHHSCLIGPTVIFLRCC